MSLERDALRSPTGRDTVQSVGKLLLGVLSLGLVLYLASLLPGIDRLIPGVGMSFAALASAIVAVAVAGVLLYAASGLATLTRLTLSAPKEVGENVASIVYWLVVLAAVLVAHRGLAPAASGLFESLWVYDAAFLLLALPPLVFVAARLYVTLDPAAKFLADEVAGE